MHARVDRYQSNAMIHQTSTGYSWDVMYTRNVLRNIFRSSKNISKRKIYCTELLKVDHRVRIKCPRSNSDRKRERLLSKLRCHGDDSLITQICLFSYPSKSFEFKIKAHRNVNLETHFNVKVKSSAR